MATRTGLCRSKQGCGELVDLLFCPGILPVLTGEKCGNLLFHVEHFREPGYQWLGIGWEFLSGGPETCFISRTWAAQLKLSEFWQDGSTWNT
jgi:hypothetical protein